APALVADDLELAALDVAFDALPFDLPQLRQVLAQLLGALAPVTEPGVFRRLALVGVLEGRGIAHGDVAAVGQVLPERGVPLGRRPEPIPASLRPMELDGGPTDGGVRAEGVAHVDVRLRTELHQRPLEARVLPEGLDEGADAVE